MSCQAQDRSDWCRKHLTILSQMKSFCLLIHMDIRMQWIQKYRHKSGNIVWLNRPNIDFYLLAGCTNLNVPMAHGSSHRPRRCVECNCDNGRISCTRQDPIHDCPKLNCPIEDQIHEEGECCKVCKGMLVNLWSVGGNDMSSLVEFDEFLLFFLFSRFL